LDWWTRKYSTAMLCGITEYSEQWTWNLWGVGSALASWWPKINTQYPWKKVWFYSIYAARFVYYERIIQSPLHETDNTKFVAVFNVGLTCNSVIKFSFLLLADQKRMFGLSPIPHHWFVNIFYTTAYEFVRVIRTRIQIAVTCNCCLIWLHNTLKFPSCTAYCTFTWCQFELGPKRTTTLPPIPPKPLTYQ